MRKMLASSILTFAVALAGVALLPAAGCDGGGAVCENLSRFDPDSPDVSFRTDVLPVFQMSCGLSGSCHGSEAPAAANQPYLGPNTMEAVTPAMIDAIFAQIVGQPSAIESGMAIVEPGDPEQSFLMYKVDGKLECGALACAEDASCGDAMPLSSGTLDEAERDTIRRWIAQGAAND